MIDVSDMIGAPQIAATVVLSKGSTRRNVQHAASLGLPAVYGTLFQRLLRRSPPELPGGEFDTPDFGGVGLLAVTDSELVLVELKAGAVKRPVEVTARVPLAEVTAAVVGGDWSAPHAPKMTIAFADRAGWQFEATPQERWRVKRVMRELAERVASA
jgi:hypothetical protein